MFVSPSVFFLFATKKLINEKWGATTVAVGENNGLALRQKQVLRWDEAWVLPPLICFSDIFKDHNVRNLKGSICLLVDPWPKSNATFSESLMLNFMSTPYARTHTHAHIHPPEEIHIHISSPPKEIYWMNLTAGSCMVLLRASWLMGGCRSQGLNPVLGLTRSPPCIGWPWYGMVWCQSRGLNRRSAGIWMSSPSRQFWLSHSHFRTKLPVGWSQCWQLTWDLSAKIKPSSNRMTWDKLFSRHNMRSCGCSDFLVYIQAIKKCSAVD